METKQERAARYRAEAERVRREAETMHNEGIRQQLLNIATTYEQMAIIVERMPD
jgi:hypothetical protein